MLNLSIHKVKIFFLTLIIFSSTSCMVETAVDTSYSPTVVGYAAARKNSSAQSGQGDALASSAYRVQNPRKVPVIVNDPFAQSIQRFNPSFASQNALRTYSAEQIYNNRSYGSLANSEQDFIRQDVLMQNNSPAYPAPTFGQNIYTPYGR